MVPTLPGGGPSIPRGGAAGDDGGAAATCPAPAVLQAAFDAVLASTVDRGLGLAELRCTADWVTAWTVRDPSDPNDLDPAVLLFQRKGSDWIAVAGGLSNQCLDRVPSTLWSALDCY